MNRFMSAAQAAASAAAKLARRGWRYEQYSSTSEYRAARMAEAQAKPRGRKRGAGA